jgi:predicted O-methyltransferase YrrM
MEEGIYLYSILRKLKPDVAVETGVCNGFSTAFILLALETNTNGFLYSLDMPEIADVKYEAGVFWDGKKGAVIPRDQQPGWAIPTHLKDRWNLTIGRSQDCLPNLLEKLKSIDFFIHDSEHSYECQYFECTESFKVLKEGGVLMVDDVEWNSSFYDFANEKNKEIIHIGSDLGFFVK